MNNAWLKGSQRSKCCLSVNWFEMGFNESFIRSKKTEDEK